MAYIYYNCENQPSIRRYISDPSQYLGPMGPLQALWGPKGKWLNQCAFRALGPAEAIIYIYLEVSPIKSIYDKPSFLKREPVLNVNIRLLYIKSAKNRPASINVYPNPVNIWAPWVSYQAPGAPRGNDQVSTHLGPKAHGGNNLHITESTSNIPWI